MFLTVTQTDRFLYYIAIILCEIGFISSRQFSVFIFNHLLSFMSPVMYYSLIHHDKHSFVNSVTYRGSTILLNIFFNNSNTMVVVVLMVSVLVVDLEAVVK